MSHDFPLPDNLPIPLDDGDSDHLGKMELPDVSLLATDGTQVNPRKLPPQSVIYVYPITGRPDKEVTPDGWENIPGARGCTPESCEFRNLYHQLLKYGAGEIFGLSTQSTEYQREARDRLNLPFELLSDVEREFTNEIDLPTFSVNGKEFLKRLTMVITNERIEHVFYPVFPPDEHANEVLEWLTNNIS